MKKIKGGFLAIVAMATMMFLSGLILPGNAQIRAARRLVAHRVGKWLPSDQQVLDEWRAKLIRETDALSAEAPLMPVIQEFKELIENDPELFMLFTQMFEQVPQKKPFLADPAGNPQVKDYKHML